MRTCNLVLNQSAYPPLLSASVAVAWKITGIHTARLGVTMVAVLDACALAAAAPGGRPVPPGRRRHVWSRRGCRWRPGMAPPACS